MTDEELVQAARSGDRAALEELVTRIQKPLYNLAVRMLWHPADAEDATQEILIKIITQLLCLSRAREAIRNFVGRKCGLANPANPCRCHCRVEPAIEKQRLDPAHLLFARNGDDSAVLRGITEMDELERAAALFRTHPTYQPPDTFQRTQRQLLASGQLSFLK